MSYIIFLCYYIHVKVNLLCFHILPENYFETRHKILAQNENLQNFFEIFWQSL